MEKRHLKIFSFFSGCGFLDLGFEFAGFDIELVNEFQASFMKAYIYSREQMGMEKPKYGYFNIDINEFLTNRCGELHNYLRDAHREENLIGFIGGPPCPDFSVAGKNKGKDGENGKLSLSYINLIIEMQPDFFLFENVKGLWKTARHRTFFEELKAKLEVGGYLTTQRLVNALEYGAPQDRDRIFMFGIRSEVVDMVYGNKINLDKFPWDKYRKYDLNTVKGYPWPKCTMFAENSTLDCPEGVPRELTVEYWFQKNRVGSHPNGNDYFMPKKGLKKMLAIPEGDVSKKSFKRLHRWRYSPTVAYGNNEVHLHPYKARRLSASEALALQTLPKEFELPYAMTLTDKFKTIGNGVPFLLANGIAKTVYDFLEEQN